MNTDQPEEFAGDDPAILLAEARQKAGKLLERLIAEQMQIDQNLPSISPHGERLRRSKPLWPRPPGRGPIHWMPGSSGGQTILANGIKT
jgi:hypothetical protein